MKFISLIYFIVAIKTESKEVPRPSREAHSTSKATITFAEFKRRREANRTALSRGKSGNKAKKDENVKIQIGITYLTDGKL